MKGKKMEEKWIEMDQPELRIWIFLAPIGCFPLLLFLCYNSSLHKM